MSRILEAVFVLGCSLVGLGMSCKDGSLFQNSVKSSIQLVNRTENRLAWHTAHLQQNLLRVPVLIMRMH